MEGNHKSQVLCAGLNLAGLRLQKRTIHTWAQATPTPLLDPSNEVVTPISGPRGRRRFQGKENYGHRKSIVCLFAFVWATYSRSLSCQIVAQTGIPREFTE